MSALPHTPARGLRAGRPAHHRPPWRNHFETAQLTAWRSRTCATPTAFAPTATAAPAWSKSRASARWRPAAAARRPQG